MENNEKAKAARATFVERLAIHDKLKEVIEPIGDGFYRYKEGWDDETVAKAVSNHLTKHATRYVRNQMGYKCHNPDQTREAAAIIGDLSSVMNELHKQAQIIDTLMIRIDTLERKVVLWQGVANPNDPDFS